MYTIIGANGFLGSYLIRSILANTSDNIVAAARGVEGLACDERVRPLRCDVTSPGDVLELAEAMSGKEPCKVFYLAAYHNIDGVEQNPKAAWAVNITALASFLGAIDPPACLFFSSTDCVYGDGRIEHRFTEKDTLEPLGHYGSQKAAAECLVTACGGHALRSPYMFGPSLSPQKKHFYDKIIDDLKHRTSVRLFTDAVRSALDYATVADMAVRLAEKAVCERVPNVLNLCSDEALSKYDLGLRLAKKEALPEKLILPVEMREDHEIFQAKRAGVCLMDNTLLKQTLGLRELKMSM